MTALADVDIFQDFPPEGLARLAAQGQARTFAAGEPLLRQGEVGTTMYVIVRGRVRKERSHPDLSEPAEVLELGPGESVGELCVLDGEPRPETVTAVEPTETIALSAGLLAETLLLYPVLSLGLLSSLSRSLRTLDDLEACARRLRHRTGWTAHRDGVRPCTGASGVSA
jgi:CRP/FNR family cyclic AMP-dependent transcriptional regulator